MNKDEVIVKNYLDTVGNNEHKPKENIRSEFTSGAYPGRVFYRLILSSQLAADKPSVIQ